MTPKKIGIVGSTGKYGRWFTTFFLAKGSSVKGLDIGTGFYLEELVRWADVVIFCVPIPQAPGLIKKALKFSREGQFFIDITSIKGPVTDILKESDVEFACIHPLFAPPKGFTWRGESVGLTLSRIVLWSPWWTEFVKVTRANFVRVDTHVHDSYMLSEQNMTHLLALAQISVCKQVGLDPRLLWKLSTKLSRKQFAIAARILSQDPKLYADIQLGNAGTVGAIDLVVRQLRAFRKIVVKKDKKGFVKKVQSIRDYVGQEFIDEALKSF